MTKIYEIAVLAKKMMEHIINYAEEIGCHGVEPRVMAANKNAVGFFERMGMKERSRTLETDF